MNVSDRITEELKTAMKQKDQVRMDTLRMLKSDFKNAEIDKRAPLAEDEMLAIVQKSIKKRQDAIEMYRTGNRQDLVDKESREAEILKAYLPAQMGEEEIRRIAEEAVKESGAASRRDMGKVMGVLMPRIKGRADGKLVQRVVSALLP